MKFCSFILILVFSLLPSFAKANDSIEKIYCTQAIGYASLDELKIDLLINAKRLAVNELFGEFIATSTAVENFVITQDQIRTSSVGFVRVEGSVIYQNGENLAEVCVTIRAFTTGEDKEKFTPVNLSKRNCVSNSDLTTRQLTVFAKEEAILQALLDYDRRLEKIDKSKLLHLMQRVEYSESGFISETETYCTRVSGYITPIEIIALLEATNTPEEDLDSSLNSLDGPTDKSSKPDLTPVPTSDGTMIFFGQSKNINGLIVTVGQPDYESGCGGKVDFEVTLSNQTKAPIVMNLSLSDIRLLGDGEQQLALHGELGAATPRCYSGFTTGTLAPDSTTRFVLRTTNNISDFNYLDLVFGEKTGRLSGETWRLDLNTIYSITRPSFGESINVDGLEVIVGSENYFPGCDGSIGFQVELRNTTEQPITLGMSSGNLRLYADNDDNMSIYSKLGEQSTDCYSSFSLETIKPKTSIVIAVRTITSLSALNYVDFVFEGVNRLNGLRWRLVIPR